MTINLPTPEGDESPFSIKQDGNTFLIVADGENIERVAIEADDGAVTITAWDTTDEGKDVFRAAIITIDLAGTVEVGTV